MHRVGSTQDPNAQVPGGPEPTREEPRPGDRAHKKPRPDVGRKQSGRRGKTDALWSLLDWRSILIIALLILVLSARWWVPPLLNIDFNAIWADKTYRLTIKPTDELSRSRAGLLSYRVAVINHSQAVANEEVRALAAALQTQVHRDLASAWGIDANLTFVPDDGSPLPNSWWLEILNDSDKPGMVSYHDVTPEGLPRARIFPRTAKENRISWTLSASHELLNMLVDPRANLGAIRPSSSQGYVYEICDPVESDQNAYTVAGIAVSDFVFPAWFNESLRSGSEQFDYGRHVREPFQVLQGGHANIFEVLNWRVIQK
jgi:hypothetical protein